MKTCPPHDLPDAYSVCGPGWVPRRCARCRTPFRIRFWLDTDYADSIRAAWVPITDRWRDRKYLRRLIEAERADMWALVQMDGRDVLVPRGPNLSGLTGTDTPTKDGAR